MRGRRAGIALLLLALAPAACGPVSQQTAERRCAERAAAAGGPRGEVTLGVAGDRRGVRPVSGIAVSISSDALAGRDPAQVWEQCVVEATGRLPTRPWPVQASPTR